MEWEQVWEAFYRVGPYESLEVFYWGVVLLVLVRSTGELTLVATEVMLVDHEQRMVMELVHEQMVMELVHETVRIGKVGRELAEMEVYETVRVGKGAVREMDETEQVCEMVEGAIQAILEMRLVPEIAQETTPVGMVVVLESVLLAQLLVVHDVDQAGREPMEFRWFVTEGDEGCLEVFRALEVSQAEEEVEVFQVEVADSEVWDPTDLVPLEELQKQYRSKTATPKHSNPHSAERPP